MSARTHSHRRPRRLRRAFVAAGGVALISGGAAFAFWTSTGSGSGTASSSTPPTVTVVPTASPTGVNPGVAPQTLAGNFTNPGPGNAYVTTVVASIAAVVKSAGAATGTCDSTDYVIANPTMQVSQDIQPGSGRGSWTGATLGFVNKTSNQDACKGATVTVGYSAN